MTMTMTETECENCDGDGRYSVDLADRDGEHTTREVRCWRCDGTGETFSFHDWTDPTDR
jgi:DnaJ-class molecular chaperone